MTASVKADEGKIAFHDHCLPTLAPGEYVLTAASVLKADGVPLDGLDATTETFFVAAPRTELTGAETYSCYPAPGQIGEFHETLPHIVFDRCTLPWERTIDASDPTQEHDPWLALILLTDADFKDAPTPQERRVPPVKSRTLDALLHPEGDQGDVVGPIFELAKYERLDDPCRTLDLPVAVVRTVMPRKADLRYLAHVREVQTDHKETWSLLKDGRFSVVVCNRFPESESRRDAGKDWGILNSMFLVSLEGWQDQLDRLDGMGDDKTCRLLVLGTWRFTCQGVGSFQSLMSHLDDKSLLHKPSGESGDQGTHGKDMDPASAYVEWALDLGFLPLNHDLRNDDRTISWYRGPLIPVSETRSLSYPAISCADSALRCDPRSGLFDASHAAAWQLGQLLALQDQAFAQALLRFRTDFQRWIRRSNSKALKHWEEKADEGVRGILTNIRPMDSIPAALPDRYAQLLCERGYLSKDRNRNFGGAVADVAPLIPLTVQDWLGQALLLYGVPFNYLVPDGDMLPRESIRFFYLDPQWIDSLLQGACSVGRASRGDELADQLLRSRFFDVSERMAREMRSVAKQGADIRREGSEAPPRKQAQALPSADWPDGTALHWPLSGFLLRSAAVEAWVGLEALAKGVDDNGQVIDPLQVLRMDRLAPDVLLCIYNGKVTHIEVRQPPEALHFGAAGLEGVYSKAKADQEVKIPMRGERVIDIASLAESLRDPKIGTGSAAFAGQMIHAPAKVIFDALAPKGA